MRGWAGITISGALLLAALVWMWTHVGGRSAAESSADRNFICSETRKAFSYTIKDGDQYPVMSPYTNRPTGFPAEKCYWTADGKAKTTPTLVLLNMYVGVNEPTRCPDCGREVFPHNPRPPAELMREAIEAEKRK